MRRQFVSRSVSVALLALTASFAPAQTPAMRADGHWHFVAGLYGWFPAIEGSLSTRDFVSVPIDMSFSELWDHLKFNLTGHFEAGADRFGFGADFFYVRLAAPVARPIPEFLNASVNLRQLIAETFGYYRVVQGPTEYPWSLEVLGGIRYWDTNARLESDLDVEANGRTIDWVDGFGGLRVQLPIYGCFFVLGRGDVGAGGAKLDWSASGDIGLATATGWVFGAGYRTLHIDYDKNSGTPQERLLDLSYSGPRVWVAYTW